MTTPIIIDMTPFRELVVLGMPDTFELRRDTAVSDNAGGQTVTTATVAAGPCRITATGGGAERVTAERLGYTEPKTVTLPYGVPVQTGDRLRVNGTEHEVGAVVAAGSAYDVQIRVIVEERG